MGPEVSSVLRLRMYLLEHSPVYIGRNPSRIQLEKIYGKEFPLNTIFLRAIFNGLQENEGEMPAFVCYEDFKSAQKGDVICLKLAKGVYEIQCDNNPHCQQSFDEFLRAGFEKFRREPDAPYWGIMSLVEGGVLHEAVENGLVQHGKQGSPLVLAPNNP